MQQPGPSLPPPAPAFPPRTLPASPKRCATITPGSSFAPYLHLHTPSGVHELGPAGNPRALTRTLDTDPDQSRLLSHKPLRPPHTACGTPSRGSCSRRRPSAEAFSDLRL